MPVHGTRGHQRVFGALIVHRVQEDLSSEASCQYQTRIRRVKAQLRDAGGRSDLGNQDLPAGLTSLYRESSNLVEGRARVEVPAPDVPDGERGLVVAPVGVVVVLVADGDD